MADLPSIALALLASLPPLSQASPVTVIPPSQLTRPSLPSQNSPVARPEMVCRATLEGNALFTTFQHPNGYRVEGIWTLLAVRRVQFDRPSTMFAELLLDHLIESDVRSGRRAAIPLALRIRLERESADPLEVLRYAISAWCGSVLWASEEGVHLGRLGPGSPWLRT